jgi:putative SOS response-associated peptidase YedK
MFEDLFKGRLEGSGAKIPRAMETAFLESPQSAAEKRIERYITEFAAQELQKIEKDLFAQSKRLADAERTLLAKVTKKAQNDQRIATDKISKLKFKIERLKSEKTSESDSRIYPGQYAPLIIQIDGERVVAPFRYHLRPMGQSPDFDRKYDGCYNARRDSLSKFVWKPVFGRNHGFMEIKSFWENVKLHDFEKRKLAANEEETNLVLRFDPQGLNKMLVPCLFDYNTEGDFPLQSFALITDEPNPEVAAAGHNRTPIIMKDSYIDRWLSTQDAQVKDFEIVFNDKQPTYFEHRVAA